MTYECVHILLSDARESQYYSIIADEMQDASCEEQIIFCLWWVNKQFTVFEESLVLYSIDCTKAGTIEEASLP
jgi:hypothetical protein